MNNKDKSGVNLLCDKECIALSAFDHDWKNTIKKASDSIIFIDEGSKYIESRNFSKTIKGSDNYFVIITREDLYDLPYSVEEIYRIKMSCSFHKLTKLYDKKRIIIILIRHISIIQN